MSSMLPKEARIQIKLRGMPAELYECSKSKPDLLSAGILALAKDQQLAPYFFNNMVEVKAILKKHGIEQDINSAPHLLSNKNTYSILASQKRRDVSPEASADSSKTYDQIKDNSEEDDNLVKVKDCF